MISKLDVLIFGGGAAGLWLLDELIRRKIRVLLIENRALGDGQTVASQGIIHGGIKYRLTGLLTPSAQAVRGMPSVWRDCLVGRREPKLCDTGVLSPCCYLWRTASLKSKVGLLGARLGLQSGATRVSIEDRPTVLATCPGDVFRVEEQVIDVVSFLQDLAARHVDHILKAGHEQLTWRTSAPGQVEAIIIEVENREAVELRPGRIVLTAGSGNAALRSCAQLPSDVMQSRPLHMVLIRGALPGLFGHCVDGGKTRVTITSCRDSQRRTVWLLGGQIAEDGVRMEQAELIDSAKRELKAVLPGANLPAAKWSTYRVDRAEEKTKFGLRPHGPVMRKEGSVITAWPTKLVLVPRLVAMIAEEIGYPSATDGSRPTVPAGCPSPDVAMPPWETQTEWHS